MLRFYRTLKHDDKLLFWQIISNLFLVVFTFWLGLSVQNMIINKSTQYNDNKTRVDHILPVYNAITSSEVFLYTTQLLEREGSDALVANHKEYIIENIDVIIADAKALIKQMSTFRYYVNSDDFNTISANNASILLYIKFIELYRNYVYDKEIIKNAIVEYCKSAEFVQNGMIISDWDIVHKVQQLCDEYFNILNLHYGDAYHNILSDGILNSSVYARFGNEILVAIVENASIVTKYLTPNRNAIQIPIEPWTILCIGILIIVIIGFVITKVISQKGGTSVSSVDYNILQRRLTQMEQMEITPLIAKDEYVRLQREIEKLESIIEDDMETQRGLREEIRVLKEKLQNN